MHLKSTHSPFLGLSKEIWYTPNWETSAIFLNYTLYPKMRKKKVLKRPGNILFFDSCPSKTYRMYGMEIGANEPNTAHLIQNRTNEMKNSLIGKSISVQQR